jgi:hypothetical protein
LPCTNLFSISIISMFRISITPQLALANLCFFTFTRLFYMPIERSITTTFYNTPEGSFRSELHLEEPKSVGLRTWQHNYSAFLVHIIIYSRHLITMTTSFVTKCIVLVGLERLSHSPSSAFLSYTRHNLLKSHSSLTYSREW